MLFVFYLHLYCIEFTFMNNRLQQFLTLENLTPARLADMLGIQRSGLSHILSGRNKPGYDFILKLCTKFPHLNANWFITGQGKPYQDSSVTADHQSLHSIAISTPASAPAPTPTPFQNFGAAKNENYRDDNIYNNSQKTDYINKDILKDSSYSNHLGEQKSLNTSNTQSDNLFYFSDDSEQTASNEQYKADNQYDNAQKSSSYPHENQINAEQKAFVQKKKSIKRLIIFYNDGSFEELFPDDKLS